VVNASYRSDCRNDNELDDLDRTFDYYARMRNRLFAVAAGNNNSQCPYDFVTSPAKGWNVLSVGAYDDQDDPDWMGDVMADFSDYVNPDSPHSDHEKPEVVAPGVNVVGIKRDGELETDLDLNSGTSFSAPQVAGLAALLIDRNDYLVLWPEALRAILMASANHNIDGPTGIPSGQDLKDGAGGINAALADSVAQTYNTSPTEPCEKSCWWGVPITNDNFPVDTYLYRHFHANQGEPIRIAISWWSNADCASIDDCNYSRLDTDLHLGVHDPDGIQVPGAWSASWDNNYELVEFTAAKTGIYKIAVYKMRADEASNYLGIALARPQDLYLPLVLYELAPTATVTPTATRTITPTPCPYPPGDPRCTG
jgi:hypothetical protein